MSKKWTVLQYSRGQVDRAGKTLVDNKIAPLERMKIFDAINNWRSSHSYPLHLATKNLHKKAKRLNETSVTARRLKRLSSIIIKLKRNRNMKLTQMQDIGGCRAIMPSIEDVNRLVQSYERSIAKNPPKKEQPATRTEFVERYDYITSPKPDGYRSFHFVFKYRSTSEEKQAFDGLRIEVQIRSQLQHAWATAVETVSTFTDQALKTGLGDDEWKRFFALMGSLIAIREDCPTVPNTPTDKKQLIAEVKKLFHKLQVEVILMGISAVVSMAQDEIKEADAYLLVLDANKKTLEVNSYSGNELLNASADYLRIEEKYVDDPSIQAVLVSVDSLSSLQNAYPNYYLDTRQFLDVVRAAITDSTD